MGLFGLLGPKCPIDPHEWEWMLASLKWLEQEFPRDDGEVGAGALILPTTENFPPEGANVTERAQKLFERVKIFAEMTNWPTELHAQQESGAPPEIVAAFGVPQKWSDTLGTFSLRGSDDGTAIADISYNPGQISDPEAFVATMAHELAHYLMSAAQRCPPGGWDVHELTTDLTAVWMGFGIFQANTAKDFAGFTDHDRQGWQMQSRGYLHERALITAIAVCASMRGEDALAAVPYLKPYLKTDLKNATKFVGTIDVVSQMAAIDLDEFGVEISDHMH